MWLFALIPFVLQAICIFIDEAYFHYKRGLPKWEKIGHPIDTFSVIICLSWIIFMPFSPNALKVYVGLAIFSCLLVTKDEFVHKHHCPASENWLHALLFILHPITLAVSGLIWLALHGSSLPSWLSYFLDNPHALQQFIYGQLAAMTAFFIYQIVFWNWIWKEKKVLKF